MNAGLFNDLGVLLIACCVLAAFVRALRDKSWKAEITPLDQKRMRSRIYYWPSVGIAWALAGLIALFVIYEAGRVLIALWRTL